MPDFQSGSLSIYYRISKVVLGEEGGGGIFPGNSIGLYKIPLEKEKKAFYHLQVGLTFNEYLTQAQFRHHFTESNKT